MSKPSEGRSGDAPETCRTGGTNENNPKMKGDLGHGGQTKISSYMSPTKMNSARPPLQEENSATHNEGKHLAKASVEVHKKADAEKIKLVATSEVVKDIEDKQSECNSTEASPDQKKSVPESNKKSVPESNKKSVPESNKKSVPESNKKSGPESNKSVPESNKKSVPESNKKSLPPPADKTEPKKMVKTKSNRRKVQGTKSPNRKVTDYFPVRRSCRKSKKELEIEERKRIDDLILNGIEDGMKIDMIPDKGRGVFATRNFHRGEFVVEYHGDLIETTDAKRREAEYAQDSSTGCYMYYFQYLNKTYCVDATKETNRLGRLINHSKNGNCLTKLHDINNVPHLILIAARDIKAGEELLYDYGDRSKSSIEAHPWLKN